MPGSSNWHLTSSFPTKILYAHLISIYAMCPAHLILIYFITKLIFYEQYRSMDVTHIWHKMTQRVQNFAKTMPKTFLPRIPSSRAYNKIYKEMLQRYHTIVFCVYSQGNRFALEKHVDDNTKQHLMLMCSVVTKQQHQIVSLKSALSRLSLNYTGNITTAATQQLLL